MSEKQHILMLLENNPYPRDRRVLQEAQTLVSAGHSVIVISPSAKDLTFYDFVDDVRAYRYPAPPELNGFLGYVLEYGVALVTMAVISVYVKLRHGFTVIHAHNPPDFMVMIALFYKLFGVRFIFDHHDLAPEMYSTRGGNVILLKVLQYFERLTCQVADHIIVTNESYKRLNIERNSVDAKNITIVRNGPTADMMHEIEADTTLKNRAPIIIGYLGEIGINDGVDYLVRSLNHLKELRQDWYCIIIGDGAARSDAEQLMHELDLSDVVEFAGWKKRSEFLPLLAAVDIGVEPIPRNDYTNHSTMIKIMEYMALGLPVVAFDLDEHRFTAQDAAIYAQSNEERDFSDCLSRLIDSPEHRQKMITFGQSRIRDDLMWSTQEEKLLSVYEGFISN